MNKKIIFGLMVFVGLVMLVIGYLMFPASVIVQVNLAGEVSNRLPKILALGLIFGFTLLGSILYLVNNDNERKYLFVVLISYLVWVLTLVFNR